MEKTCGEFGLDMIQLNVNACLTVHMFD